MAKKRNDWVVIGISGVTCGGKTSLALKLLNALYPVHVYHQDEYFYPDDSPKHKKCKTLDHNNYDILESLDMETMTEHALATMQGERSGSKFHLEPAPGRYGIEGKKFLVLEGFTVLNYRPLRELCDLRYYFVLSYEECFARRVLRLYDPPDVEGYFEQCVWPEHLKYKEQLQKDGSIKMLEGTLPDSFEIVLSDLRKLGAKNIPE